VAVLIDQRTASAAEAVLIAFRGRLHTRSFGRATAGVPTGNVCHRLADGSLLAVTESVAVDRTGNTYGSAIAPDTKGTLSTAHCWLTSHPTG
jgi:carboxyl-terminal processing protease